eukprot:TRINITY_DN82834_c0_g1_i1.p1 TRINITY_DN82834_c0_g1~~TRINITY_DN82834_c0_g1_i1.p1  ORF type:complete len:233 (-),score=25.06 TRINITY_DN82834_c0_g1_i1:144-776(-)
MAYYRLCQAICILLCLGFAGGSTSTEAKSQSQETLSGGRLLRREILADGSTGKVLELSEAHNKTHKTHKTLKEEKQVPCKWGPWSDWTSCSATCGAKGERVRTRLPEQKGKSIEGKLTACKKSGRTEVSRCGSDPCPKNCKWSEWSDWTDCSETCGGGKQSRHRFKRMQKHGGKACKDEWSERRACKTEACPKAAPSPAPPTGDNAKIQR